MKDVRIAVVTPYYKEPLKVLKKCHNSVMSQTYKATHIMVSDGGPKRLMKSWDVMHIQLPHYGDFGATPRCVGSLIASSCGFDGIAFLDADNWFEPDHIEHLLALQQQHQVPVVTATRNLIRKDYSLMGVCKESDGIHFNDTNCYLLMREAFWSLPAWVMKDGHATPPDRLFWKEIVKREYPRVHSSKPTVNYVTTFAMHYLAKGEKPPKHAKIILKMDNGNYRVTYEDIFTEEASKDLFKKSF